MATVYVGAGSNIEPERHLHRGLAALAETFGEVEISPAYRSRPVGFEGEDFINLVLRFQSTLAPAALVERLHRIETDCGRERDSKRFAPRVLDLDLLMVDGQCREGEGGPALPRDEITRYAFVLRPLAELAPDLRHPLEGITIKALWERCRTRIDQGDLRPVALDLPAGVRACHV